MTGAKWRSQPIFSNGGHRFPKNNAKKLGDNLIISPDLQPQQINKALERPNTTSILSGGSEEHDLTETTEREDMGTIKLPTLQNKTEQRNDPPAIPVQAPPQPKTEVPKPSKNVVSDTSSVKSRSKKYKKPSMSKSEIHQKESRYEIHLFMP